MYLQLHMNRTYTILDTQPHTTNKYLIPSPVSSNNIMNIYIYTETNNQLYLIMTNIISTYQSIK